MGQCGDVPVEEAFEHLVVRDVTSEGRLVDDRDLLREQVVPHRRSKEGDREDPGEDPPARIILGLLRLEVRGYEVRATESPRDSARTPRGPSANC